MSDTTEQPQQTQQQKVGLLTDDQGKNSMMRLMSFISLIAGILFAWLSLNDDCASKEGLYITTVFLLAAFAPKAVQKFIEKSYPLK